MKIDVTKVSARSIHNSPVWVEKDARHYDSDWCPFCGTSYTYAEQRPNVHCNMCEGDYWNAIYFAAIVENELFDFREIIESGSDLSEDEVENIKSLSRVLDSPYGFEFRVTLRKIGA